MSHVWDTKRKNNKTEHYVMWWWSWNLMMSQVKFNRQSCYNEPRWYIFWYLIRKLSWVWWKWGILLLIWFFFVKVILLLLKTVVHQIDNTIKLTFGLKDVLWKMKMPIFDRYQQTKLSHKIFKNLLRKFIWM